mmetsp:Transcript_25516/g.62070  ORF Transcript_25516/g.62070 Transcript_25516/m.62070 type:complete len:452 (-) Transcript_25516:49-1404(-)
MRSILFAAMGSLKATRQAKPSHTLLMLGVFLVCFLFVSPDLFVASGRIASLGGPYSREALRLRSRYFESLRPITVASVERNLPAPQVDGIGTRERTIQYLHDECDIPYLFLEHMSPKMLERLSEQFQEQQSSLNQAGARKDAKPRVLFIHPQNGLGNRMRVVGSGIAWAKSNGPRILIVVWEKDIHMQADFFDLFQDRDNLVVINKLSEAWPLENSHKEDVAWNYIDMYNYMETEKYANKGALVVDDPIKHVYFRACELIATEDERAMQRASSRAMRQLRFATAVLNKVVEIERRHGTLSNKIGVHIRQMSVKDEFSRGFNATKEYGTTSLEKMEAWRSLSSLDTFAKEMRAQLKSNPASTFFVATDSPAVFDELDRMFPGKISSVDRREATACRAKRNLPCTRLALADLIALTRTELFLGSLGSSFTNMVVKLHHVPAYRRVGIEFAVES